MIEKHRKLVLKALSNFRGDNLERAQSAFRFMTPEQMNKEWGQSGMTCAEILKQYKEHVQEVESAIEWIKGAK